MNKFSIILNVALICLTGCLITKSGTGSSVSKNCETVCLDYRKAGQYNFINGTLLDSMAHLYQQGIATKTEAQSVWYSLEDLKRFIWEIESKACKSQCSTLSPTNLGVRIYFAKYPGTGKNSGSFAELSNLPETYEGMHTLFMVPTYDLPSSNMHTDFNLLSSRQSPVPCIERMNKDAGIAYVGNVGALFPDGKNHGPLCPPDDCTGAIFSSTYR